MTSRSHALDIVNKDPERIIDYPQYAEDLEFILMTEKSTKYPKVLEHTDAHKNFIDSTKERKIISRMYIYWYAYNNTSYFIICNNCISSCYCLLMGYILRDYILTDFEFDNKKFSTLYIDSSNQFNPRILRLNVYDEKGYTENFPALLKYYKTQDISAQVFIKTMFPMGF